MMVRTTIDRGVADVGRWQRRPLPLPGGVDRQRQGEIMGADEPVMRVSTRVRGGYEESRR